ncbi:MAG TPA: hypothetical protein VK894_11835 [Jiangellales bacterium]|nr:hypothetical protein [Jiangellales bacterium]
MRGTGPVEQSFPGLGRGLGLAQCVVGVAVAALTAVAGEGSGTGLAVASAALAYAAVAYLLFVRPAVLARTGGIHLRGEIRDVLVPWGAVDSVEAGPTGLRVVTGDRVLRARGFAGAPPGARTAILESGPHTLRAAEVYCQEVAAALQTAARRHQASAPAGPFQPAETPTEVVRWPLVALPALLILAAVVVAVG